MLLEDGVLTLKEGSALKPRTRTVGLRRVYGRFERRIPLGYEVDDDKVSADFKNGVLTVSLPKTQRAQAKAKRIAISGNK